MPTFSQPYVPRQHALADKKTGLVTAPWESWFRLLWLQLLQSSVVVGTVSLTGQSATIGATAIPAQRPTGLLLLPVLSVPTVASRVSYRVRVTQAGTISSSVTVTIGWTEGGLAMSQSGDAVIGNTTTTQQNDVFVIKPDAGTLVTYAVAYASAGATVAKYDADFILEQMPVVSQV